VGRTFVKFDWWLIISGLILSGLGLLIIRSVAPEQFVFQLVFVVVSFATLILFSLVDYRILLLFHLPIYVVSVVSLFLPFVFGLASRGAHRWLQFGQISVQPSELIKPFLLLTFAQIAVSDTRHKFWWLFTAYIFPAAIIFMQPDLGTVLVITVGWLAMVAYIVPKKWVIMASLALFLFSPVAWFLLRHYQKDRLLTFINPYADPLGRGYHVIQSVIAVGSGGTFGRGLGHGTQSGLRFLPEHYTDFIFASLSEELGFLGGLTVIILFAIMLNRIQKLAVGETELVIKLYSLGILAQLTFQIFVNMGMNMGLAPVTGITLPFLSYGGSSLLSLGVSLGIVNSMAMRYNSKLYEGYS